ncbi:MAG: transposase [Methanogenium sp.]|nr:transposase [Methanogenium sp.]
MVSFADKCRTRLLDGIIDEGTPITELLFHVDLTPVEKHIKSKCYALGSRKFSFDIGLMLRLVVLKKFRNLSFRKTLYSLTNEDCLYLRIPKINGEYRIPSSSSFHGFMKYRLGEEGFREIMELVGAKLAKAADKPQEAIIDSTPLEASRYNPHALFNPHYLIKMDKAHIFHYGNYPLYMVYSNGTTNDKPCFYPLIQKIARMNPEMSAIVLDAGYDTFEIHAKIWRTFGIHPLIQFREDAVIHDEGTLEGINHWVNKMWKEGGDIHQSIEKKLRFLYDHGRKEQVGKYLRNINCLDEDFYSKCKNRSQCERKHKHIKDTVKFDIRSLLHTSKKMYTYASFISYQILILAHAQLKIENVNVFCNYI